MIADVFHRVALRNPDRIAIMTRSESFSYRELLQRIERRVGRRAHGRGRRIMKAAPTSDPAELWVSHLALMSDGWASFASRDWPNGLELPVDSSTVLGVLTSGTAGVPKMTFHSESGLLWGVWNLQSLVYEAMGAPVAIPQSDDELVLAVGNYGELSPVPLAFGVSAPLDTIAGLSVLHRALLSGDTFVSWDASQAVASQLESARYMTNLAASPFLAGRLLRDPDFNPDRFTRLLAIGVGGAPAGWGLMSALEGRMSVPTSIGYGSTEAGGVVATGRTSDPANVRWGSCGRQVGAAAVKVDDCHDGEGELLIRSPSSATGQIGERTDELPGGWVRTSDRATITDEGNVIVHGRLDDTIIRAGRRIDPTSIENLYTSTASVDECVVVGVPSAVPGETDVCLVVRDRCSLNQDALRRIALDHLEPALVPRWFLRVRSFPFARDGNISRQRIQSWATRCVAGMRSDLSGRIVADEW